jgi:hypothetical protein
MTHSENSPASSAFGKLLRRRANPSDPDEEHWTAVVLHPTQSSSSSTAQNAEPRFCHYRCSKHRWLPASACVRR